MSVLFMWLYLKRLHYFKIFPTISFNKQNKCTPKSQADRRTISSIEEFCGWFHHTLKRVIKILLLRLLHFIQWDTYFRSFCRKIGARRTSSDVSCRMPFDFTVAHETRLGEKWKGLHHFSRLPQLRLICKVLIQGLWKSFKGICV